MSTILLTHEERLVLLVICDLKAKPKGLEAQVKLGLACAELSNGWAYSIRRPPGSEIDAASASASDQRRAVEDRDALLEKQTAVDLSSSSITAIIDAAREYAETGERLEGHTTAFACAIVKLRDAKDAAIARPDPGSALAKSETPA